LFSRARVVVVPLLRGALVPPISTILNAMAMGKCVIVTEGPGVTEMFEDELVKVPVEDPTALAAAIERVWTDAQLRRKIATAGWNYGMSCGGEQDLYGRVIDAIDRRWPA
jgi:glycosyltransferase involved in cell wall biosynthesis